MLYSGTSFFIAIGNFDLSSLVYFPREDFLSRVSLFIPHRITKLTFKIKTNWLLILCIYYGHFLLVVNHLWQTHLIYITTVTPSYPDLSQRSANEWDHYLMVENNWSDRVQYCALSSKNIGVNEKNNTKQNKSNNNIKWKVKTKKQSANQTDRITQSCITNLKCIRIIGKRQYHGTSR